MKSNLRIALAATVFTAALFVVGNTAFAGNTIRLGFIADATGVGESWYKSQRAGIDLFIEETNASGGILGKKLELVVRDSALKPDLGAAAAEDLILNEKCDFLIGPHQEWGSLAC
jgi:branched-chain amino acid transport system substrate-binding protein